MWQYVARECIEGGRLARGKERLVRLRVFQVANNTEIDAARPCRSSVKILHTTRLNRRWGLLEDPDATTGKRRWRHD